jgi:hypothetical protein
MANTEYRICKKNKKEKKTYYGEWYPLSEMTTSELSQLLNDMKSLFPGYSFWIEYR